MHEIPVLDSKGLRNFGLVTGAILALLFGLFFPWLLASNIPWWPWAIASTLVILAMAAPNALAPVYKWWMRFGLLLGKVTTPVIMAAVFFLVILPFALVLKLRRRDAMARTWDAHAGTYRVPSRKVTKDTMTRPF